MAPKGKPAAPAVQQDKQDRTIITPIGIACFVHVFEPFAFPAKQGDAPKEPNYSLMLVFNKKDMETDPAWTKLKTGVSNALREKFGDQAKALLQRGKLSLPWRDANEYEQYGPPFEDGNIMISVKSKNPPGIVDERSRPIMDQSKFYPGALARVSCYPWAFDSMGNKGCTLLLNNVQKAGEGERLAGGRMSAEAEFQPLVEGGGGGDDDASDLF
jgi:hypothetical protein